MSTSQSEEGLVSFSQQNLKLNTAESAQPLITKIADNLETMTILDFSGNTMGIEAAEALKNVLSKAKNLKVLRWHDMFTGRMKTEIAPALEHLSEGIMCSGATIEELDLSHNAFGPNGVVGVTKLLASPSCYSLKVLKMDNQGLGHHGCSHLVNALNASMDASDSLRLRVFSAGRNRLENFGAGLLAQVFQRMGSLEELALYQNGIGIHGPVEVKQLLESLKFNVNLKYLDLSDNSLKPSGAEALSLLLPFMKKLEKLNVSDCILKRKGCEALTEIFNNSPLVCPLLQSFSVSGNEFTSDSTLLLIQALFTEDNSNVKRPIQFIDLNANALGESGIENVRRLVKMEGCEDVVLASFSDDEGSASEGSSDEEGETTGHEESGDEDERDYILQTDDDDSHISVQSNGFHEKEKSTSLINAAANFSFKAPCPKPGIFDNLFSGDNQTKPTAPLNLFGGFSFPSAGRKTEETAAALASGFSFSNPPTTQKSIDSSDSKQSFHVPMPSKLEGVVSQLTVPSLPPHSLRDFLQNTTAPNAKAKETAQNLIAQSDRITKEKIFQHPTILETLSRPSNVDASICAICLLLDCENVSVCNDNLPSSGLQVVGELARTLLLKHPSLATNALLVQMGLIKSEEKRFEPSCKEPRKLLRLASYLLSPISNASSHESTLPNSVVQQLQVVLKNLNSRLKSRLTDEEDIQALDILVNELSTLKVSSIPSINGHEV